MTTVQVGRGDTFDADYANLGEAGIGSLKRFSS
jgi:hypothetical protein